MYGLGHCFYFHCAMNESNSIAQAAQQPLFLCPICLRKLHKVIRFDLKERYLHLAHQCKTLHELLQSYDTSSDGYPECSAVSTNDTHTSEHACTSTSVDLMTGSSDHVSSPYAGDRGSSSGDAVLESTESSSVEQQQNSSPHDSEVLQSPTAQFTHAVEWLHTTVTSLSNFYRT